MGRVCVGLPWKLSQKSATAAQPGQDTTQPAACAFPLWLQSCSQSQAFIPHRRERKKKKPKASAHPSLDQLFLQLEIA